MYLPHPDLAKVHLSQLHREAEAQRLAAQARPSRVNRPALDLARRWATNPLRRILPGAAPRLQIDPLQRAA